MTFNRPCLRCGILVRGASYCDGCRPVKVDSPERKAKKQAKYGGDYRRRANAIKSQATHCHICNEAFKYGDRIEADHLLAGLSNSPLAPAHRECNRKRGNTPLQG